MTVDEPKEGDIVSICTGVRAEAPGVSAAQRGHREVFRDGVWHRLPLSDWYQFEAPRWLSGSALDLMAEIGIETDMKSAVAFTEASDSSFGPLYYLAVAAQNGVGVEALKWVMSNMAAELNIRKLSFADLGTLVPARVLNSFLLYISKGIIDRSFAKPVFAELIQCEFSLTDDGYVELDRLSLDPRFKAADESVIDDALDAIIAANPDQFEKARENPKLIQWFVGQAMKATQGKAKPPVVIEKMQQRLTA
jgi:Asp-tRNA(Asn)/Glu-tRNA(Gln) amidotransferase B subunit